ncbi:hypothetical protein D3C79_624180 [compost metagenome]
MSVDERPEAPVPLLVLLLAGSPQQRCGTGARFGMHPVQALAHPGLIVPAQGVDDALGTIDAPGMLAGIGEQAPRAGQQPCRGRKPGLTPRSLKVQDQTGPLERMARRCAVWAKVICGIVPVVFGQRLPVHIEMFDHSVVTGASMAVNDALDDTQGALQPKYIARHIGQGEEGLSGVHVAVGTTIGFRLLPVAGEGLAHRTLLLTPETLLDDPYRLRQQPLCSRSARHDGRAGGKRDEGMQVSRLAVVALAVRAGEPTAVPGVAQRPAQGLHTVLHQCQAAWRTLKVGQGEAVGHARGVHGFGDSRRGQFAAGVEIAETFRGLRGLGEREQPLALACEPGGMFRGIDVVHAPASSLYEVCRF